MGIFFSQPAPKKKPTFQPPVAVQPTLQPATETPERDGSPLGPHAGMMSQQFLALPPGVINNSLEAVSYGTDFDPSRATAMTPIFQPRFLTAADANTPDVKLAESAFQYGPLRGINSYDNIYSENSIEQAFGQRPLSASWW